MALDHSGETRPDGPDGPARLAGSAGPDGLPGPDGRAGPAVLELGREVGAAVIYTTAALDRAEIEIKLRDGDWRGDHTAVRKRPGPRPVYAALFFALRSGSYDVRVWGTGPTLGLDITGGRVTEAIMTERFAGAPTPAAP